MRWVLRIAAVLALVVSSRHEAGAQVFKPKAKASPSGGAKAAGSAAPKKATSKKAPARKTAKSRSPRRANTVADQGRPDDLTPEPVTSRDTGSDFVKITDDDEIE